MLQAENGRIAVNDDFLDYVRFGGGAKPLIMIPGLSDGLRTVKGLARPLALSYRELAKDFTVYMFSRAASGKAQSTREMAADLAAALTQLQTGPCCVLGVSMGGMIAQYLALDHPGLVEKLCLTVTAPGPNDTTRRVLARWMEMARAGDYRALMQDTADRSYTPARARLYRMVYTLPKAPGRPASFERFLAQAAACLDHDAAAELGAVSCPCLIVGGEEDKIVTAAASRELHRLIPGSRLVLYDGLGHAAYEEAKGFKALVRDFFLRAQDPAENTAE